MPTWYVLVFIGAVIPCQQFSIHWINISLDNPPWFMEFTEDYLIWWWHPQEQSSLTKEILKQIMYGQEVHYLLHNTWHKIPRLRYFVFICQEIKLVLSFLKSQMVLGQVLRSIQWPVKALQDMKRRRKRKFSGNFSNFWLADAVGTFFSSREVELVPLTLKKGVACASGETRVF